MTFDIEAQLPDQADLEAMAKRTLPVLCDTPEGLAVCVDFVKTYYRYLLGLLYYAEGHNDGGDVARTVLNRLTGGG